MPTAKSIIPIPVEAKGYAMFNTKFAGAALIVAATAVSSAAMAGDRGVNTAVGAVVGAAIGSSTGHRNGAIVGGVIGAAVGNSISTSHRGYRDDRSGYYENRSGYYDSGYDNRYESRHYDNYRPAPVYVQSRTYYEPAPVYYQPAPRYYSRPAVVYVEQRGHRHYRGCRHGHGHGYGHGYGGGW